MPCIPCTSSYLCLAATTLQALYVILCTVLRLLCRQQLCKSVVPCWLFLSICQLCISWHILLLTAKNFHLFCFFIMNIPNKHHVSEWKLQNGVPICKCTVLSCWECSKHQATGNSQKQAPSKWHLPGDALHNINLLYGKTFSCFVPFMDNVLG